MNTPSSSWRIVIWLLPVLLIVVARSAVQAQDEKVTLDKIYQTWQARQDRVRTLEFGWTESRTYMKGSLPTFGGLAPAPPSPPRQRM